MESNENQMSNMPDMANLSSTSSTTSNEKQVKKYPKKVKKNITSKVKKPRSAKIKIVQAKKPKIVRKEKDSMKAKSKVKKTKLSAKSKEAISTTSERVELAEFRRPNLVLQSVYFLNDNATKHISIGYDPTNDFRLSVIVTCNLSYVIMSAVDWASFMLNFIEISDYLAGKNCEEFVNVRTTKNIRISKVDMNDKRYCYLENHPRTRLNNGVLFNQKEFDKCCQLDSYIQPLLKQMQLTPHLIDDYYNWYVYHCQLYKKSVLNDSQYFIPYGNSTTFDSLRLFNEIPIYCEEKLNIDLASFIE